MKAVVQSGFGPATEVLSVAQIHEPRVGPGELLVRVRASGIAKGTWLLTEGLPYIARPSYGVRQPKQPVAGLQFAGTVEALGTQVSGFSPGDEVFGVQEGSLAELVAVSQERAVAKPAGTTFEEAAAAPISGVTALQAVRAGGVEPGHRVLVLGASGGVGSFAVQIAKALGALVTGVASTRNLATVRALGADEVVDYTSEDPTAEPLQYDVILDIAGNRPVSSLRSGLRESGALVIVGGTGGKWAMGFGRTVGGVLLAPFVRHRIVGLLSKPTKADLGHLARLMASRDVVPLVGRVYTLNQAAQAVEAAGAGRGPGTDVVAIDGAPPVERRAEVAA